MRKIFATAVLLAMAALVSAQADNPSGAIRGKVVDATTGEPLIGANVFLTGTTTGTITDFDGNFSLNGLSPGITSITTSYVSYETQVFEEVEIPAGEVVTVNANLNLASQSLQEVVVTARKREETEAAVLVLKKKMPSILDGISSQQISRLGDSNAASAIKRVTGVSVEGGKYVYIRGLSDRYSTTTLNGVQIPGLDPEKNSVQMDLFPSNIIENLMVFKTFSPDLPSNATGGMVNIVTRDFPEKFNLQFSGGLGYNPRSNLRNDFLSYRGGRLDAIGMDDGTRSVPQEVSELTETGQLPYIFTGADDTLGVISRSFNSDMDNTRTSSFLDQSYSFSMGNRISLFGRDLGFNLSAGYSRKYDMYTDGRKEEYSITTPGNPSPQRLEKDNRGTESVIWSGLANMSYKINNNHMIGATAIRNQSGVKTSRFNDGMEYASDTEDFLGYNLGWLERSIAAYQVKGKHVLKGLNMGAIDWIGSYTLATQSEPDLRFFFADYDRDPSTGEFTSYHVRLNTAPVRFYREMDETSLEVNLNYTQPFQLRGRPARVKTGASYLHSERNSAELRFDIRRQGAIEFDGSAADYLSDDHMIWPNNWSIVYYQNSNLTDSKNSYWGFETRYSGYGLIDLPATERLRIVAGVRAEQVDIFVENMVDTILYQRNIADYDNGGFRGTDLLPSLNMVYSITGDINLRLAYNRTLARPVFRELAPYASYDFKAGMRKIGNPDLVKTTIDNADLRWEWFIRPGEIISLSGFYKHFTDPIELKDREETAHPEIHFENIEASLLYGLEFEIRKKLDFFESLQRFSVGANVTFVKSRLVEDSSRLASARMVDPDWPETRVMYGQSPYVVNTYLNYNHFERGWDANIGFNVSGPKLVLVSKAATPDVYEQPFPLLDFNISKQFKNGINLKFSAENLLDPLFEQTFDFGNSEGYYRQHRFGRSFSIGLTYRID